MSPASSGLSELDRYIGASLISQPSNTRAEHHHHHHHHQQFFPNHLYHHRHHHHGKYVNFNEGWAGGVPLISFANHRQRILPINHSHQQPKDPLTRLVVHTQGAPLILTKTYNRKNKNRNNNNNNNQNTINNNTKKSSKCTKDIGSSSSSGGSSVDAVSVTSDESSGSANSENSLPRIIKPRKRRKKDRKPPPLFDRALSQDGFSTDSASPDIDTHGLLTTFHQPFLPFHFDQVPDFMPPSPSSSLDSCPIINNNTLGDLSETPKLHHSFEDVKVDEDNKDINGNQSNCQCRYCDPCGQIWDVDRNCYSPFLTTPIKLSDYCPIEDLLPKSLINSMSSLSFVEGEDKKVVSKGDLEVSTEIVTSLNGHRDLEIKFYSSTAAASSTTNENVTINE